MGLKSYKQSGEEQDATLTIPNAISVGRGAGGLALGAMLATSNIDPSTALVASAGLGLSDMEGSLIGATSKWPRLQQRLKIIPSTIGRKLDPVMDKLFGLSVLTGAAAGGQMPIEQAAPLIATEVLTAATTMYVTSKGSDPEVSKAGTWGMVSRVGAIVLNLAASANTELDTVHEALEIGGAMSTTAAVTLGVVSCHNIWRQRHTKAKNQLVVEET